MNLRLSSPFWVWLSSGSNPSSIINTNTLIMSNSSLSFVTPLLYFACCLLFCVGIVQIGWNWTMHYNYLEVYSFLKLLSIKAKYPTLGQWNCTKCCLLYVHWCVVYMYRWSRTYPANVRKSFSFYQPLLCSSFQLYCCEVQLNVLL